MVSSAFISIIAPRIDRGVQAPCARAASSGWFGIGLPSPAKARTTPVQESDRGDLERLHGDILGRDPDRLEAGELLGVRCVDHHQPGHLVA